MTSDVSEAIILCGGKGKRLRSVTQDEYPKGLVPIQSKSILKWEIEWLSKHGISHIILAVGHLGEKIEEEMGHSFNYNQTEVKISYSFEETKLGSGGAVKLAMNMAKTENVILINGDILTNFPLNEMIDLHKREGLLATMHLTKMRSPYGVVEVEGNKVSRFLEKPLLESLIHGGIDIVNTSVISRFPEVGQMEETIFVDLADEAQFAAFVQSEDDYWRSVDSEKDFDEANLDWPGL